MRKVIAVIWCVLPGCGIAFGQPADFSLSFEVASVKLAAPPAAGGRSGSAMRGGPGSNDPEQITYTYATLRSVLLKAYDVKTFQLTGPAWLDSEHYDIIAKVPPGATKDQFSRMLQNLLTERFHLALRRESKELQVYDLVVGKNGSTLKESASDPNAPPPPPRAPGPPTLDKNGFAELDRAGMITMRTSSDKNGIQMRITAKGQPISMLTQTLENELSRPVRDQTGLGGKYDFTLEYTPEGSASANDGLSEPHIATAVQEQLGLRLEQKKAPVEMLVIDRGDKTPTEN
jgi:uncharacterized protein (TIGR03435 family)